MEIITRKEYKIRGIRKAVKSIYPLFTFRPCERCGNYFRRGGWKYRRGFETGGGYNCYFCGKCFENKKEVVKYVISLDSTI